MMSDMPERIWVDRAGERHLEWARERNEKDEFTEQYVRADKYAELEAALKGMAEFFGEDYECWLPAQEKDNE